LRYERPDLKEWIAVMKYDKSMRGGPPQRIFDIPVDLPRFM
jgi:hypothetical protein